MLFINKGITHYKHHTISIIEGWEKPRFFRKSF